jgi:hypothetical protein
MFGICAISASSSGSGLRSGIEAQAFKISATSTKENFCKERMIFLPFMDFGDATTSEL